MRRSKVIYVPDRSGHKAAVGEVHWLQHAMVRPGKKPYHFMISFSQSWQSPSKTAKVKPAWRWNMFEPMPRGLKPAHPKVRLVDPDDLPTEEECDDVVCSWH